MQKNCINTTLCNVTAGFPQHTFDMLTGAGQSASLAAQIAYDPAVYAQIAAMDVKAWKTLPKEQGSNCLRSLKDFQNLILNLFTAYYSWEVAIWGM